MSKSFPYIPPPPLRLTIDNGVATLTGARVAAWPALTPVADPALYPIRVLAQDELPTTIRNHSDEKHGFYEDRLWVQGLSGPPVNLPWNYSKNVVNGFDPATRVDQPAAGILPRLLAVQLDAEGTSVLRLGVAGPGGNLVMTEGRVSVTPAPKTEGGESASPATQVLLAPAPDGDADWVALRSFKSIYRDKERIPSDVVQMPPMRHVLGAVRLGLAPEGGSATLYARLAEIGWRTSTDLVFTPDGLVVDLRLPFPGQPTGLPARCLLHSVAATKHDTGLRLRLLSGELEVCHRDVWHAAWSAIRPAAGKGSLHLALRAPAPLPPELTWSVCWSESGNSWEIHPEIEVPKDWLRAEVVGRRASSASSGGKETPTDGSATLLAERVSVAAKGTDSLTLRASAGGGNVHLSLMCQDPESGAETMVIGAPDGKNLALKHDARELSTRLRAIQGERPELSGFVAADRGWVQLPLPSVPPFDPELDSSLVSVDDGDARSVIDGFMRWSAATSPTKVSATLDEELDLTDTAPWSLTVEEAAGFSLSATIRLSGENGPTLKDWTANLAEPEISTRGLLWLSGDRPDAQEALPRLGAGPGSFFDVPFEIRGTAKQPPEEEASFALVRLELDPLDLELGNRRLVFTPTRAAADAGRTWAWLRHPRLPLASTMPMTRSGEEGVRPLESRDLAPFRVVDSEVALQFAPKGVLVTTDSLLLTRVDVWPWPTKSQHGDQRGVGFAALGVPGVELRPRDLNDWSLVDLAVRYDLPLLDEAFATAKLPKDPDAPSPAPPSPNAPRPAPPPPDPPVTALDREALAALWEDRARKQEVARVEESYLLPFEHAASYDDQDSSKRYSVCNLVAGAAWPLKGTFEIPGAKKELPYGALVLTDELGSIQAQAAAALAGIDARFDLDAGVLKRRNGGDEKGDIEVRGMSPATYVLGDRAVVDNRDFASDVESGDDRRRQRGVRVAGVAYSLVTTLAPISFTIGSRKLELWFKELPIRETDGRFEAAPGVDPRAWTADRAPLDGYEVRLVEPQGEVDDAAELVENIRLWMFDLTFLGLSSATISGDSESYVLRCRLTMPAARAMDPLQQGGHVVDLLVEGKDGTFSLTSLRATDGKRTVALKDGARESLFCLSFTPSLHSDGSSLVVSSTEHPATLEVERYGARWKFSLPELNLSPNSSSLQMGWSLPNASPRFSSPDSPLLGRLVPTGVSLQLQDNEEWRVSLAAELQIATHSANRTSLARLKIDDDDTHDLLLLGLAVPTRYAANDKDIGRTAERSGALLLELDGPVTGAWIDGWNEETVRVGRGLLAVSFERREKASDEPLGVVAGRIELEVVPKPPAASGDEGEAAPTGVDENATTTISLATTRVVCSAGLRNAASVDSASSNVGSSPSDSVDADVQAAWSGYLEFYGHLKLASALEWPSEWSVKIATDPGLAQAQAVASADESLRFIRHRAIVRLDGHRLALDALTRNADGRLARLSGPWHAVAAVEHGLSLGNGDTATRIRWASVEPITVRSLGSLTEAQGANITGAKDEPDVEAAFVAGHRLLHAGKKSQNEKALLPLGAIFKPGFGRRADVLGGADNRQFRNALEIELAKLEEKLQAAERQRLIVVGGFAGVVEPTGGAQGLQRLLRVPYVAALPNEDGEPAVGLAGIQLQQTADYQPISMPAADTTLAPKLALSTRRSSRPSSLGASDLWRLLADGSAMAAAANAADKVEVALLAEQTFVSGAFGGTNGASASLATTPFWIGAALGIHELVREAASEGMSDRVRRAYSLLAGRRSRTGKSPWRSVATVVTLDLVSGNVVRAPALPSALVALGDDLVLVEPFDETPRTSPALVGAALVHHVVPRVVVQRRAGGYHPAPTPRPMRSELAGPAVFADSKPRFASPQRGLPLRPFVEPAASELSPAQLSWSAGLAQAETRAVFDRKCGSGLAGLATAVALPSSPRAIRVDDDSAKGSPAAAAESAAPLHGDARAAASQAQLAEGVLWLGEKRAAPYLPLPLASFDAPPFQWLTVAPPRARLPIHQEVTGALAKAGVTLSEGSSRSVLPESLALASVSERSGILTARRLQLLGRVPGTVPIDDSFARFGVPAQASGAPLRQVRTPRPGPLPESRRPRSRFVRGVVETLSGTHPQHGRWSAVIAAMPATGGLVSNLWDGSLRLRFLVEHEAKEGIGAPTFLFVRESGKLRSLGWLRIGSQVVPLATARFLTIQSKTDETTTRRDVFDVELDVAAVYRHPSIGMLLAASALDAAPAPDVELCLLVHPDEEEVEPIEVGKVLDLSAPGGAALPSGSKRLPVTLSWPLAAVSTSRGAMPLRPVSLVFTDETYDAELTSEPQSSRREVSVLVGGDLPKGRGRLHGVFFTDRRAVRLDDRVAVMADLRLEKRRDDPGEDDLDAESPRPLLSLSVLLLPRIGPSRELLVRSGVRSALLALGRPHELALAAMREEVVQDGKTVEVPVAWQPGDRLAISLTAPPMTVRLVGGTGEVTVRLDAPLVLHLLLSAEPAFEPPPALYAVLSRERRSEEYALSVPLFAQSPQPTRVDAENLTAELRCGLVRRRATFLWRTAWPIDREQPAPSIYVMKQDRNGQTHVPEDAKGFVELESPMTWKS